MQSFKKIITIILFLGISLFFSPPAFSQTVAGTTFPYARIDLRTPTHNDPFPGLGTYYSALSDGINTARWNPASLMKIEHAQGNLSLSGATNKTTYNYNYATDDSTLNLGSQTDFSVGYYFTGDETVSTAAKREHTAKTNYTNQTTQLNFAQALKVN
ncbi:MAG: hypothetical protein KJ811_05335, partial [Candidatus Margulisbacteria bacterium]|nr:hypothetical protein [Candidatus Margulisiibacteriota bacterium]